MSVDPLLIEVDPVLAIGEVVALYRAVGWLAYADHPSTLGKALAGSSLVVVARRGGQLVGLARVLSDGATICYLQDVLVHPAWRRAGVGRALVLAALAPYEGVRQKVLMTDDEPGQRAFYESLGYRETRDHAVPLRAFVRFDDSPAPAGSAESATGAPAGGARAADAATDGTMNGEGS